MALAVTGGVSYHKKRHSLRLAAGDPPPSEREVGDGFSRLLKQAQNDKGMDRISCINDGKRGCKRSPSGGSFSFCRWGQENRPLTPYF